MRSNASFCTAWRRRRADRFQSAQDLGFALEAAGRQPIPAAPAAGPGRTAPPLWRADRRGCAVPGAGNAIGVLPWGSRRARRSVEGSVFAQITDDPGAELFPSLSPDGKAVVYAASRRVTGTSIFNRSDRPRRSISRRIRPRTIRNRLFHPTGRSIAFRSDRGGGGIFIIGGDGAGVRRIADSGYNPAWSPDGREIAYAEESITRPEDRSARVSQLWTVDVSSGRKRLVSQDDGVQPRWSPNGQYLAYWAIDRDGNRDLWTVRASGGPPVRITRDAFLDWIRYGRRMAPGCIIAATAAGTWPSGGCR